MAHKPVNVESVAEVYQASSWRLTFTGIGAATDIIQLEIIDTDGSTTVVQAVLGATVTTARDAVQAAINGNAYLAARYTPTDVSTDALDIIQKSATGPFTVKIIFLTSGSTATLAVQVAASRSPQRWTLTLDKAVAGAANDQYISQQSKGGGPAMYTVVSVATATKKVVVDDVLAKGQPSSGTQAKADYDGVVLDKGDSSSLPAWAVAYLADTGRAARIVADASVVVGPADRSIEVSSGTSAGNYTITFDKGVEGQKVFCVLPAALGGTDAFELVGLEVDPGDLDAAGDNFEARYSAAEDKWYVTYENIA